MKTVVLVGTGIGDESKTRAELNIATAVSAHGYKVASTVEQWPRDHYVHAAEKYVVSTAPGWEEGNAFGEGGLILTSNDFLLISDCASIHEPMNKITTGNKSKIYEAIVEEGKKQFPTLRTHVAPSGYFHGAKGHEHLDMFALLLPKARTLIIDTHYGKNAAIAPEYDAIAKAEGLKLIKYNGAQDGVWYPLNSPVIPHAKKDVVVIDDEATSLCRLLEKEGADIIRVKMPRINFPAGKIRCQTNTFNLDEMAKLPRTLGAHMWNI